MSPPSVRIPAKSNRACGALPEPESLAGGFWFPRLSADSSRELRGFATLGWYIEDQRDSEAWSQRFLNFKDGRGTSIQGAALVLGKMLEQIDWARHNGVAIISAMSSSQSVYDAAKPAARLAALLGERMGFRHIAGALRKQQHRRLHTLKGGASEREQEISGKYELVGRINADLVIICDDMITRGNTLGEIARAIRVKHPQIDIVGLGLGKSERASFAARYGKTLTNGHLSAAQLKEWDNAR